MKHWSLHPNRSGSQRSESCCFSCLLRVDGEGVDNSGGGGELGGVAMCLLKNNIN